MTVNRLVRGTTVLAASLLAVGVSHAAGPVEELYGKHLTILTDFDAGDVRSSVNGLKGAQKGWTVGDGGLFGSKALVGGEFDIGVLKTNPALFDTRKPLTVLFWLKLNQSYDPIPKQEPGMTHFMALWSGQKRFLVFRQAWLGWGHAPMAAYFHDGGYTTRADAHNGSLKNFKPGEWHLMAAVCRPDGFAMSVDGKPFITTMCTKRIGPAPAYIRFATSKDLSMDDCAVLDFAMTDDQVKELWDEYQARMKETVGAQDDVRVTLEKCDEKDGSSYEVVLTVKNVGTKPARLRFAAKGTPRDSQPAAAHDAFTLAPNAEKTLRLTGPALGDESVVTDIGLVSDDMQTTYFRRHRVFTPHAPEPEWMRAPSAVSFKFGYYPYENTVHAAVDVTGCDDFEKLSSLTFGIYPKDAKKPVAEKTFKADPSGRTEIFWRDLPELDGEYVCRVKGTGIDGVAAEQAFLRKRFEWEHNEYGMSDTIPAPFTPVIESRSGVEVEERKVSVVLRDHIVDTKTGLWKQVNAAGKELLARPMALVSSLSSRDLAGKDRRQEARDMNLSTSSTWDVDGLMIWKLTLPPGHYEPMALEIPLKREVAWLYHACTDGLRFNPAGRIPAGEGRVWDSSNLKKNKIIGSYLPYLWIGGTLRGLSVFGENDKGWVTSTSLPCQEIIREKDAVVIRLNLIQRSIDLKEPQTIRLGFMATPVKPMLENWRGEGHGHLLGSCWCWGGEDAACSIQPTDGTDEFFRKMGEARKSGKYDEAYLTKTVDEYPYTAQRFTPAWSNAVKNIHTHYRYGLHQAVGAREKGRLVFYTNARGVHYGDPWGQGRTFLNSWCRFEYKSRDFGRGETRAYELEPTASYRDFAAWWYHKMLSSGAADHLYWDDVYLTPVENLIETDAYRLPDGRIQSATGVFDMRAMIRRAAVLCAELGKDPRGNWVHMTNTAIAPICSFAGVNYDWEDTSGNEPMQVKYPKDYILACTIGRQMGNRVGIMGYFHPKTKERGLWLNRTGAGVMLTHELRWNLWSGHTDWEKYHELLCKWGYRTPEVDVWNYWDEDVKYPLAVSGIENASIVMAKKAACEAYVCVSSFSAEDGAVTVVPDAVTLDLKPCWKAVDAETGKEVAVENGAFKLDIPQYDWRLVFLK